MRISNTSRIAVRGGVWVEEWRGGQQYKQRVYNATGVTKSGDINKALQNMRYNALYKYKADETKGDYTPDLYDNPRKSRYKTSIRYWYIESRSPKNKIERDAEPLKTVRYTKKVEIKVKATKQRKSYTKNVGQYYFRTTNKRTGEVVKEGKWKNTDYDVEKLIDKGNDF